MGRSYLSARRQRCAMIAAGAILMGLSAHADAQDGAAVPTPEAVIGHQVGADYKLARWETIVDYFHQLDAASDRVALREVGRSTEDNPYLLVVISSRDTIRQLDKYTVN